MEDDNTEEFWPAKDYLCACGCGETVRLRLARDPGETQEEADSSVEVWVGGHELD